MSKQVEKFDHFQPQTSGLQGSIDNHFTPGLRTGRDGGEAGCLFTVILVALAASVFALVRLLGGW